MNCLKHGYDWPHDKTCPYCDVESRDDLIKKLIAMVESAFREGHECSENRSASYDWECSGSKFDLYSTSDRTTPCDCQPGFCKTLSNCKAGNSALTDMELVDDQLH